MSETAPLTEIEYGIEIANGIVNVIAGEENEIVGGIDGMIIVAANMANDQNQEIIIGAETTKIERHNRENAEGLDPGQRNAKRSINIGTEETITTNCANIQNIAK